MARAGGFVREKKYLVSVVGALCFGCLLMAAIFWVTDSARLLEVTSRYVPGWLAALVIASWLALMPITEYLPKKPKYLRVSLGVLFAISSLLTPVAAHFYPSVTALIWGLLCVEIFWLIPRLKSKWNLENKQG